jgi:RimJ/RimL family protein N-acetyltransferase
MAPVLIEPLTSRLKLRQWNERDRVPFAAMNADPEVMRHFPALLRRDESEALVDGFMDRLRLDGYGLWAVEVRATNQFIGFVGLAVPSWDAPFAPCTEVGWRLAASAWGHGYATEAATAAITTAFDQAALDEVVSFTTTSNLRSQKVMRRLGMTHNPAEDFDHPLVVEGSLRRHVLYRLSRASWGRSIQAVIATGTANVFDRFAAG